MVRCRTCHKWRTRGEFLCTAFPHQCVPPPGVLVPSLAATVLAHAGINVPRQVTSVHPSPLSLPVSLFGSPCSVQKLLHPQEFRVLSARELARVQGFPDHFKLFGYTAEKYVPLGARLEDPEYLSCHWLFEG